MVREARWSTRHTTPALQNLPCTAFLAHARDEETNKVFYEDYVAFLKGQQALRKI